MYTNDVWNLVIVCIYGFICLKYYRRILGSHTSHLYIVHGFSIKLRFDRTADAASWYQHLQAAVERTIDSTDTVSLNHSVKQPAGD